MIGRGSAAAAGRTIRLTVATCAVMAALCALAGVGMGRPSAGIALAAGLLIGSCNGPLVRKLLGDGSPVVPSSLARLALLSAAGLAAGLLAGPSVAWLVPLGLAAAQLVLAGAAVAGVRG